MLSESNEMYLVTIYRLTRRQPLASTTDIALRLEVSQPSVTEQLKRLRERGYVDYEWREGASLTEAGERIALSVLRKHRLLETLLVKVFGYGLDEIHEEACRLEHHLSERLTDEMELLLGFPKVDPHGQPIPDKQGKIIKTNSRPLTTVPVGEKRVVCEINDGDSSDLSYLLEHGVTPGAELIVVEIAPDQGPLMIKVNGKNMAMTYTLAQEVNVSDPSD